MWTKLRTVSVPDSYIIPYRIFSCEKTRVIDSFDFPMIFPVLCLVVMEYSPYGNLRNFLRRCEGAFNFGVGRLSFLNLGDLYNFGFQVASGMEYLWHKKVLCKYHT